jgi:hypothetical protein
MPLALPSSHPWFEGQREPTARYDEDDRVVPDVIVLQRNACRQSEVVVEEALCLEDYRISPLQFGDKPLRTRVHLDHLMPRWPSRSL